MKTVFTFLLTGMLAFAAGQIHAGPGDLDFDFDPGFDPGSPPEFTDHSIETIAVQLDGKILIGGYFTNIHGLPRPTLARLNPDGSTDFSFNPVSVGANVVIRAIVVQPDGKIVVSGHTQASPYQVYVTRLLSDGSPDPAFVLDIPVHGGVLWTMAIQADGKVLIGGWYNPPSGPPQPMVERLNPDGSLDSTFSTSVERAYGNISSIALQADGRIIIGGSFDSVNGIARTNVVRLNTDGTLDPSFMELGRLPWVQCVGLQADGKVLIGGWPPEYDLDKPSVLRLYSDGSVDDGFISEVHGQGAVFVTGITVQPDNKILLNGSLTWSGGPFQSPIARLNPDGSRDTNFTSAVEGHDSGIEAVALLANGQIVVSGGSPWGGGAYPYCYRLNGDGSVDPTFGRNLAGPNSNIRTLALQTDGKVLIGGDFTQINYVPQSRMARLNPDGSLDTNYLSGGTDARVLVLAVQSDGKCLIGGEFSLVNGVTRPKLARLNEDGLVGANFLSGLPGPNGAVWSLGLQADGKILVGGSFTAVNGVSSVGLARLLGDGTFDTSFQHQINGEVMALAIQADGKVVIGGSFSVGGLMGYNLARLNQDGSLDVSFLDGMAGPDGWAWCLAVQTDGKILVGGGFRSVNGIPRYGLARLNTDGSLDTSFVAPPSGYTTVFAVKLQPDGKIFVVGELPNSWGDHLTRLNVDGTVDHSFNRPAENGDVYALAMQPDSKVVLAGSFTTINGIPRSRVARLQGDYVPPVITTGICDRTVEAGSNVRFGVAVVGTEPLTYHWLFNGTNTLCVTITASLWLENAQSLHCGAYSVIVSNPAGTVTCQPAMLNVIPGVGRRTVPALNVTSESGDGLTIEYAGALGPDANWQSLREDTLARSGEYRFDLSIPLPMQRFYRTWQTTTPTNPPVLALSLVPALTLTGGPGEQIRVDGINQFGPTDAWFPLDTVTLTNTSQLYFDVTAPGQPPRLYRLVSLP